jgi:1,4-dihydroxy-2-naphthoate polyprenyltransferase
MKWIKASRIRTLPAAIAPVIIGCSLAFGDQKFHFISAFCAMFGAILIQLGTNFANDYFDFMKGVDNENRIGPKRATQSGLITPAEMKRGFIITFSLIAPFVCYLAYRGGWAFFILGIISVICGVLYTGGPKPLGYIGLGDIFVLIFFGPVAVVGTYYVQSLQFEWQTFWVGLASGMISTAILVVNNLRDHTEDAKVGKNTLVVQFGSTFGRVEYTLCLLFAFSITIWQAQSRQFLYIALLPFLFSIVPTKSMWIESGGDLDKNLGATARVLILFSLCYSIGYNL